MSYRYCYNHDVATGKYDCPYADVVNNSICCNCEECNYNGIYEKPVVNNLTIPVDWDPNLSEEDYPF